MAQELAHMNEDWYMKNADLQSDAAAVVSLASALSGNGNRVWVIASRRRINQPLLDELAKHDLLQPDPPISAPKMGLSRIHEAVYILPYSRVRVRPAAQ